ncbi:MAG: 23S rRNA (uracil(1939)-C(5))-methyltransferase, partial [Gammaproteobacteria bacterium]
MSRRTERVPERVEIVDLSNDGRGVAKTDGKTLFVDGALPGEVVDAVRVRRRRNFDEGRVTSLLVPAAERVEPVCAHFGMCGGCSLQHLAGEAQLGAKQRTLRENLRRIGDVEPKRFFQPISGPSVGYRRRARLGVRFVKGKGRVLAGFRERFSSFVADIDRCPVLTPPADELVNPISELIGALSLKQRIPQVEVSVGDNRTALVFRVLDDPTTSDLDALRGFREHHDLDLYLQRGGLETVQALDGISIPLEYTLPTFDLTFRFLPTDFIQVNGEINRKMVSRAIELLSPGADDVVLDLFCG